ncbi:MAG: sodium:proton antiporter [Planctomycetes bacterium]|nr:sodium:proton antiporter [Planctomycetota bacterium]
MNSQLAASAMSHTNESQHSSILGWIAAAAGTVALAFLIYYNLTHGEHHGPADHHAPPFWGLGILPFVGILGSIAILPLLPMTHHWWERNVNRFAIAILCGGLTVVYYLFARGADSILPMLNHAIPVEYVPFIVLLFSLYVISGGICLKGDLAAHPATNTGFLAFGAAIASFIGTTGASMLLIRPLLQTNSERKHVVHTVVFFIFLVSNIGGALLPIGDPPLFLGYLRGVDFFWTFGLWQQWLFCCITLLVIYYVWDSVAYRKETKSDIRADETQRTPLRLTGTINIVWLAGIVFSVAFIVPGKQFPGLGFTVFPFLRELMMLALVACSLLTTPRGVREANQFNYAAIIEVAALFVGIFIAMQVPIEVLKASGETLTAVMTDPWQFFWSTGALSSFLDNAPTYVVFFELGKVMPAGSAPVLLGEAGELGRISAQLLVAISLGAVFMGAMTYIGNGPNFMVKAIAEQSGIRMPSFFGYMFRYSIPILVPVFVMVTFVFLRGNDEIATSESVPETPSAHVEPASAHDATAH